MAFEGNYRVRFKILIDGKVLGHISHFNCISYDFIYEDNKDMVILVNEFKNMR